MQVIEMTPEQLRGRHSSKWMQFERGVIGAGLAEMDFHVAPAIQARLREHVEQERYGYAPRGSQGTMTAALESFRRRMATQFQWMVEVDDCQLVVDLIQGAMAGVLAFTEIGESVALQVPAYPQFLSAIAGAGRHVLANPMREAGGRFVLDLRQLADGTNAGTRVLLLCHPHNPTGRVFDREELLGLVPLVRERGWVVISDEIHADLVFAPKRHQPLARLLPEIAEHIVTLYSPTKSFNFPGLRCGVAHFGSPSLKAAFARRVPETLLGTPSVPGMEATLAAWNDSQPWCDALLTYLQDNRDHLVQRLRTEAPGLRLHSPEATYLAWIDCAGALPSDEAPYEFFLRQARVGLGDGRVFGGDNAHRVRLNFATSRSILDDMIDRLVGALKP